jgi:hypothetical protein
MTNAERQRHYIERLKSGAGSNTVTDDRSMRRSGCIEGARRRDSFGSFELI